MLTVIPQDKPKADRTVNRSVLVEDPDRGVIKVWWTFGRGTPWLYPVGGHGRMAHPACPHVDAAAIYLARELLGLEVPADAPVRQRTPRAAGPPVQRRMRGRVVASDEARRRRHRRD